MIDVFIADALRTAVAPRSGAFRMLEAHELAAPLIRALHARLHIGRGLRIEVILGNALYGGGNPARVAALDAGLDESVPAFSIDTQCCSGLDAIALGASRIAAGMADIVFAGGVESWSRAPLRMRRPRNAGEQPQEYARPPFTPWADRDPDLIASAAALAADRKIPRVEQEAFAIESHRKALLSDDADILPVAGVASDAFTRALRDAVCQRLPALAGQPPFELTSATTAVEADAAALVVLTNESALRRLTLSKNALRFVGASARGFDPAAPALAPCEAARLLMASRQLAPADIAVIEIMEAFAVQAMAFVEEFGFEAARVNRGGGALARGHPIGASGAILAARLFHELQKEPAGSKGWAAIAAAGGLGSAMLLER